jgi:hypothetical protein
MAVKAFYCTEITLLFLFSPQPLALCWHFKQLNKENGISGNFWLHWKFK